VHDNTPSTGKWESYNGDLRNAQNLLPVIVKLITRNSGITCGT